MKKVAMRTYLCGGWLLVLAALGLTVRAARPDEATLRDGRRLPGKLTLSEKRWRFLPAGQAQPLSASSLHRVRLETRTVVPLRAASVHRVTLSDGQGLTGVLRGLDDRTLSVRTAWAEKLALPRAAVAAVTHQPGWTPVFLDDFTDGLKAWKVEGKPETEAAPTPDRSGLVFNAPGQAVEYALAVPLREGRASINFNDNKEAAGATWVAEAAFQTPAGPRVLSVTLAGASNLYEARVPGLGGAATPAARSSGWHRLSVQFTATSLRVVVDESVLWHSLKHGPGGPLLRWRLACRKADAQTPRGQVRFAAFALQRTVDEPRRPPGDASQDEIWLLSGDQLFGHVLRADRRAVVLRGRFGQRTLPWNCIRGIYLRRGPPLPRPAGERVRLWVENGTPQADELEGFLSLDERRWRLRHALLGTVELERDRVRRIQWPSP